MSGNTTLPPVSAGPAGGPSEGKKGEVKNWAGRGESRSCLGGFAWASPVSQFRGLFNGPFLPSQLYSVPSLYLFPHQDNEEGMYTLVAVSSRASEIRTEQGDT